MQPEPIIGLAKYTDWATIATPFIACVGFYFAFRQLSETRRQVGIMAKQLDDEVTSRVAANTPYFELVIDTSSNGTEDTYSLKFTNVGLIPAFEVRVGYYQQDRTVEVPNLAELQAFPVGVEKQIGTIKFPTTHRTQVIELYIKYKNIYGDSFVQTWKRSNGAFKPDQPPRLIRT